MKNKQYQKVPKIKPNLEREREREEERERKTAAITYDMVFEQD